MKKTFAVIAITLFTAVSPAYAVCPICTVAVGTGLGLAQWLGIDDTISGLWIGGLTVSVSLWTISWLKVRLWGIPSTSLPERKKRILESKRVGMEILVFIGYYLIIVGSLWWKGFIGKNPFNTFCGMDKLLFGIISGSVLFEAGAIFHSYLRKKNNDKSYFKGQKIALPITFLIIASIILYLIC